MKPELRLVKLTRKHYFVDYYTHRIEIRCLEQYHQKLYYEMFKWCTEQFGPGLDKRIDYRCNKNQENPLWAFWVDNDDKCYIYLRGAALTKFLLERDRWENYNLELFDL